MTNSIDIKVNFNDGRCFFNDFNADNDRNPTTGKAGVNYCRYKFIGALFSLIGLTYRLDCTVHVKKHTCYLYKKSMNKWFKRHEKDPAIIIDYEISCLINDKDKQFKIEKKKDLKTQLERYINQISINYKKNLEQLKLRRINPGIPLSYNRVLEEAQKKFSKHAEKEKLIKKITELLEHAPSESYKERLDEGVPPYFGEGYSNYYREREMRLDRGMKYDEYRKYWNIHDTAHVFLASLPGIDITPYTGSVLETKGPLLRSLSNLDEI